MLRFVAPKGSLEEQTLALLEAADLRVRRGSTRDYHGRIDDDRVERISLLRPQEIPRYVEEGFFDLGITGRDWVEETGADVSVLTELTYAKGGIGHPVRIVLAVPIDSAAEKAADLAAGSRISTEYPELTKRHFDALGISVKVFVSYGATEAKVPDIVDAIVDVSETGGTLRSHGMKIIETLMESGVLLIANPTAAADGDKRRAMEDIRTLLEGAMAAQGRVLIKLNVDKEELDSVLSVLPAMKAPTVSPLAEANAYAIETVVEKATVNTLIPLLKAHGATDILELPISKIVP
ncbi:MAG TPA: ATP phosphoribosyltransferase [Actinomycetota bacterium]|jgi:ATP phosphoribosyltransferase|nr:ATP phosphoribosyltransferase [Actinomycetota bacterium]